MLARLAARCRSPCLVHFGGWRHRFHAVQGYLLVVPTREAAMDGGGETTLYLLPGLVVSTAAATPSRWDLSGSPQVGAYV